MICLPLFAPSVALYRVIYFLVKLCSEEVAVGISIFLLQGRVKKSPKLPPFLSFTRTVIKIKTEHICILTMQC